MGCHAGHLIGETRVISSLMTLLALRIRKIDDIRIESFRAHRYTAD